MISRPSLSIHVRVLSDVGDFESLRDRWDRLLERTTRNVPFSSWAWYYSWWKHFGGTSELFLVLGEDSSDVLVTGGIGLLGREVARLLVEPGRGVRVLSGRLPPPHRRLPGVHYAAADLADGVPEAAPQGIRAVVHCAAEAARATVAAALRPDDTQEVMNLVSRQSPTCGELIERLQEQHPEARVIRMPRLLLYPLFWIAVIGHKVIRPGRPAVRLTDAFASLKYEAGPATSWMSENSPLMESDSHVPG